MTKTTGIAILSACLAILCLRAESAPAGMDGQEPDNIRSVNGTVRDTAGRPLEGVRLQVCPHGGRAVLADEEGKFEVTWHHSDWVQADYLVARHAEKNLAVALPVDEQTEGLNVVLQPAILVAGMVADPNGRPIPGADVRVDLRASNWGSPLEPSSTRTDADGRFEVRAVPPDNRYSIAAAARAPGQSLFHCSSRRGFRTHPNTTRCRQNRRRPRGYRSVDVACCESFGHGAGGGYRWQTDARRACLLCQ